MAVAIEWGTRVITVLQADLTSLGGDLYELDIDWLRKQLKDLEDSEYGMPEPDTHIHNVPVTVAGVTYARTVEIVNGYTVTISPATAYTVTCTGANHNVSDVFNNTTGPVLIVNNAAGLVETAVSGLTTAESTQLADVHAGHDNKKIADRTTGVETIYEDDGVTPRKQFDLWKDEAETERWDGDGGISVRDPI